MHDLKGKVGVVTGAGRGIGRGIALELALAGAAVIVSDREIAAGAIAVAQEIANSGGSSVAIALDVTDRASIDRCMGEAIRQFHRIDILVNNAGVFQRNLGFEVSEAEFNECLDVNLTGIWRVTQSLVPHFKGNRSGRIINIASVGGRLGVDFAPAYCAAKAGVINLTQSLAASLGPHGITVNTVCPGAVSTAMQAEIGTLRSHSGATTDGCPRVLPLIGPLTVHDIGRAAVFFASDSARCITGQALNVDRGEVMN